MTKFGNLTFLQVHLISQLLYTRGIRDLARKNSLDPSAVSRLLKELEDQLGFEIAIRSKQGLTLTQEGEKVARVAAEIVESLHKFEEVKITGKNKKEYPSFVCGSRGFLSAVVAGIVSATPIDKLKMRIKFVDSSPQDLLKFALAGIVDVAIHFEEWKWGSQWISEDVGNLTWALIARNGHPIGKKTTLLDVQKYPFVAASYIGSDRIERSADIFPLKWSQRTVGHESQTAFTTREILMTSDHIGFLPLVTVEREIQEKKLHIVQVAEMASVKMKLFLSVNQDKVPQQLRNHFVSSLKTIFEKDEKLSSMMNQADLPVDQSKFSRISL
ncbi:MAG: LysR substrate-binding domain-containing protein [Pseudobdellovibrionaceae bacterium]